MTRGLDMTTLTPPGRLAGLAGLAAAAMLVAALVFQYVGGLAPCPLCIWQRWPHAAAALLGAVAAATAPRGVGRTAALLGAATMAIGAALGLYHAGVEQGWWRGPETCAAGSIEGLSTAELIERIKAAPIVRCDEIPWSFLGLSMAAWNALISVGLSALFVFDALGGRSRRTA